MSERPAPPALPRIANIGFFIIASFFSGARVRKRHGLSPAADAVAKAPFVPLLPTIKPVTNWAKLGQFLRWI